MYQKCGFFNISTNFPYIETIHINIYDHNFTLNKNLISNNINQMFIKWKM